MVEKNKFYLAFFMSLTAVCAVTTSFMVSGCAFMPRMALDEDSGNLTESISTAKYNIHIHAIDNAAVLDNGRQSYHYVLGRNDQVVLYVWGHPEFSSPLGVSFTGDRNPLLPEVNTSEVNMSASSQGDAINIGVTAYTPDENGNIYVPLIGQVKIENRSITNIKNELTKRLTKYVVNPQVSLRVANYRSKKIYVLGEVNTPKTLYLNDTPLDLATSLISAGWVNLSSADVQNIYVLRLNSSNNVTAYRLDATSPTNMLFANAFILRPDDIVFVSTAGVAQLNRVMPTILNIAQSLWYTTNIVPVGTKIIPQ